MVSKVFDTTIHIVPVGLNERASDSFLYSEFDCPDPDSKYTLVSGNLILSLQDLRDYFGWPLIITSGYRTLVHNKKVGGVDGSFHTLGMAADIMCPHYSWDESAQIIDNFIAINNHMYFGGLGYYPNRKFFHLDVRRTPKLVTWTDEK